MQRRVIATMQNGETSTRRLGLLKLMSFPF
jgi:hypothetical protein